MTCITCGAALLDERSGIRAVDLGDYELELPDSWNQCTACGEEFHTGEQSKAFDTLVVEARRRHEGLLAGADIRRIRQTVGLSQADLENALGIGPKTLARWENNGGVQSKTVDDVLRLIEFDPDNLRLLIRIRQASRSQEIENKMAHESHVTRGELHAAIGDGLERANLDGSQAVNDAIFDAISEYKELRMKRLIDETKLSA